ncbi:MAG TPA: bifunctional histidinol-phosphatase/imidazoleglycerol-phosphate dehydratase HisB [Steroidobacteraceae bacterium]|jgi:imidazoleglycerol-phosphate dehydratase/histidinol-phosphatase|nr:bifunctional histidinol-phosphatase/imidazoleglycerol-phosphate dehydratase HisB [Steroidobacteraceae bacterium]
MSTPVPPAASAASAAPILFVDRDGTLIEEPANQQVDRLDQIRLLSGVFAALTELRRAGYRLVMISNQDGLGTDGYPRERFDQVQGFLLQLFASQGIEFDEVFICPHFAHEHCPCRKPLTGLVTQYLQRQPLDRARSAMVGDRDSDLQFAHNLGIRALRVEAGDAGEHSWDAVARALLARRGEVERVTRETSVKVSVELDSAAASRIATGIGFFDHMLEQLAKHAGFQLLLSCQGDLHIDEHHTIEDCALALGEALRRALGDKAGIGRYGFLLPMDESEAQVALDLSGRAHFLFEGRFGREQIGALPTELVPHFFRSLSDSLGAALHLAVRGENTHHMIEACFKGVGRALRPALRREGYDLPSTKGAL